MPGVPYPVYTVGQKASYTRSLSQDDFNRFAALSGDDNPIHCDPAFAATSHFGATVSHGMLLYSAMCKAFTEGLPGPGWVQHAQEFMFPNPTFVDEPVTFSLEVTAVDDGVLAMTTNVNKADGTPCAVGKAVLRSVNSGAPYPAQPSSLGETGGEPFYGLVVGQHVSDTRTFTAADVAEYVSLVGDTNPLHADEAAAKAAGLKGQSVPPPLLAGMFSDILGTRLPGRGTGWMKQKLNYHGPAYVGEALTARVEIIRLRADKELVNLATTVTTASGERVVTGEALVLVRNLEDKVNPKGD